MVVVADTSPLTALIHLNKLYLVRMLYGKVYIPSIVAAELNSLVGFGDDISFLKEMIHTSFVKQKTKSS
jgi:predicted nucleic acid-binding protein